MEQRRWEWRNKQTDQRAHKGKWRDARSQAEGQISTGWPTTAKMRNRNTSSRDDEMRWKCWGFYSVCVNLKSCLHCIAISSGLNIPITYRVKFSYNNQWSRKNIKLFPFKLEFLLSKHIIPHCLPVRLKIEWRLTRTWFWNASTSAWVPSMCTRVISTSISAWQSENK